jgi:hypothetical protein
VAKAEYGPTNSKDLRRQIWLRITSIKELISKLPEDMIIDDLATEFFELESLLDISIIELKSKSPLI